MLVTIFAVNVVCFFMENWARNNKIEKGNIQEFKFIFFMSLLGWILLFVGYGFNNKFILIISLILLFICLIHSLFMMVKKINCYKKEIESHNNLRIEYIKISLLELLCIMSSVLVFIEYILTSILKIIFKKEDE